jgi:formate-dependent nitrite reductase membrane component NrfD
VANRTSQPTLAGIWRYRIAGYLTLTAIALGFLSYINRPTANLFSAAGNDDLHRMFWLAVAAIGCIIVACVLALYEFGNRHGEPQRDKRVLTRV